MRKLTLFIIVLLILLNVSGNEPEKEESSQEKEPELGWVLFPVVFYSSDTSLGFGASAVIFKEHHKIDSIKKVNSFTTVAFYTLRNQLLNANVGNLYWHKADWHWQSKLIISKYPTDFYGIGKNSKESDGEVFEPFYFEFENNIKYRLLGALYGGITLVQGYYMLLSADEGGLADKYFSLNREKGFISGAGIKLAYDTRDDSFYPTKGLKLDASYIHFLPALGSEYNFSKYSLDLRGYVSSFFDTVIALQLFFEAVDKEPPLSMLPALGSKDLLRGYPGGRYRDKIYIAGQTELRFPIWWRFGGVLFFGAEKVQEELTEFFFKDLKIAGGYGIRFQMSKQQKINFRFDMGFTPEGLSFYFNLLEAF